jgi:glucokinase
MMKALHCLAQSGRKECLPGFLARPCNDGGKKMNSEYKDQFVIGIDVGGTGLKGSVIDREGNVAIKEHRPTQRERGPKAVIESILNFADDLAKKLRNSSGANHVVVAGVAVPGLIDEETGVVLASVNLEWKDVPLRQLLEEHLSIPAVVGHDVRTASIAEQLLGAARGSKDFLFLTLGTGVGAAVVLHGTAYVGAHHIGGEFGHMVVLPGGPLCGCGRHGCIETLASASAVVRRYRSLTQAPADITSQQVAERVQSGDPVAGQVWGDAIGALSIGIANYITLLDPERIVIGGGMADAGQMLFQPLITQLATEVTLQPVPPVLPAALGNDAGYLGAALKAWFALGVPQSDLNWRGVG